MFPGVTYTIYIALFDSIQISRSGSGRIEVFGHIRSNRIGSNFILGGTTIGSDRIGSNFDFHILGRIGSHRATFWVLQLDWIESDRIGSKHVFTHFGSDWIENCILMGLYIESF